MSELKGQILGIVLVLMVFAAISATLVGIFTSMTNTVSSNVSHTLQSARMIRELIW